MVQDLVDSVRKDYQQWMSRQQETSQSKLCELKDRPKKADINAPSQHVTVLDARVDNALPTDSLRGRFLGKGGQNFKKICIESGARLFFEDQGPSIRVLGPPDCKRKHEHAVELTKELIESVRRDS